MSVTKPKVDPYIDIVGLPSPLRRDQRFMFQVSPLRFAAFFAFIPFWLGAIMPLTIFYQVTTRVLRKLGILEPHPRPPLDSGHIKAPETIQPRKDRKYDIVVLGVTGFTGRLAARHLAQKYGAEGKIIKWAIAGRNKAKVEAVRKSLAEELKMPKIVTEIDIIVADTSDPNTMPALVEDTRAVATTAGPYQEYGNTVVEFCAKYGTHYTDITGEVGWVKQMMVQHGETAKSTGAKIVPFCGHDCIPWDLSVMKLQQLLKDEFNDDLKTVKVWDEALMQAPGGTYQTAMLSLSGNGLYPWTAPFVMALINAKIVRWTYALRQQGEKKISYRETQVHRDFMTAFTVYVGTMILGSSLLNPLTKWLAYQFILPLPGNGPSSENLEKTNYLLVTAEGVGTNGNRVESTFYLPKDPGCLETAKMMVEAGLAMALHETNNGEGKGKKELPSGNDGGFFPPAACLGDVLLDRLIDVGIEYKVRTVAKPEPTIKDKEEDVKPKDKDA
ncbi:Trans-acting enoyl reductase [Seminavis robusta]|uniref:Trans-acting enoyl reductase n=1 Tax=Seminavis robusta TaxID=568900 RepID=A0A9N8H2V4_9STRA|nr:Trans-acting enoyl reductase [Seminavis robusta]|eukprot:Sro15_g011240.1 Trans-acting enoyl reductase (499) ;mRNA; r:106512-108585